jgi:CheY-like chemotaxis protein
VTDEITCHRAKPTRINYTVTKMSGMVFPLAGMRILLVDDEPDILEMTALILSEYKAEVIAVTNAIEGLSRVQRHKLNVIVSDIGMPHMDGYQFIREVRRLPDYQGAQTPAVALTAFDLPEDRARAFEAGFQKHLSKPVDLQVLVDTILSVSA